MGKDNEAVSIPVQCFADDLVALTKSAAGMQRAWDMLTAFSRATGLEISCDSSREKTVYTTNSDHEVAKLMLNGAEIPRLAPEESYKYLGVYVNLNLDWEKQKEEITRKLKIQTNYIKHRAFTAQQTVMIINKVFIPSVLYRANVIALPQALTRSWDMLTTKTVFRKLNMPPVSGRNFLFEPIENSGMGLLSIEMLTQAAFIESYLSNGLNATDRHSSALARMRWNKREMLLPRNIKIISMGT